MENNVSKDKDGQKGSGLSGEDKSLWEFVTRSIRPLENNRRIMDPGQKIQPPKNPEKSRLGDWIPAFGLKPAQSPDYTGEQPGLDRRTAERLRRGEMPIEARLDLHGLRQGEAQDRLVRFLLESYASGRRCVLVITGKGNRFSPEQEAGILRRMLPVWLGMMPLAPIILAHAPAKARDGGSGAFYILLRRQR
jgi:DNA-nicking Smr family endonuclease